MRVFPLVIKRAMFAIAIVFSVQAIASERLNDDQLAGVQGGGWWRFKIDHTDWYDAVYAAVTWGGFYFAGNTIKAVASIPTTWPSIAAGTACGGLVQAANKLWEEDPGWLSAKTDRRIAVLSVMWRAGSTYATGSTCNYLVGHFSGDVKKAYNVTHNASRKNKDLLHEEMHHIISDAASALNASRLFIQWSATYNRLSSDYATCEAAGTQNCQPLFEQLSAAREQVSSAANYHFAILNRQLAATQHLNATIERLY